MKYSKEALIEMYRDLVRGRVFIERLHTAVTEGMIRTSLHSAYGQEAVDIGIISALGEKDWIMPSHRSQAALIAKLDPYGLFCEICGKADGLFRGVAYDYHIADFSEDVRILPNIAVLGGQAPTAAGFAFALKYKGKKDEAVVTIYGDGQASEGPINEAYNLASLFKTPVVFVLVNNEWAMTVPLERQSANPNLSDRAIPYGLATQIVDGYDILAVREAMEKALTMAKSGQPNVVEFKILRWTDHFVGQGGNFRNDTDRIAYDMEHKDPVKLYEKYLLDNEVMSASAMAEYKTKTIAEFEEIAKKVRDCAYPVKEDIIKMENIYATPETGGEI